MPKKSKPQTRFIVKEEFNGTKPVPEIFAELISQKVWTQGDPRAIMDSTIKSESVVRVSGGN